MFVLKQIDASTLFALNSASVYNIKEVAAKQEGLEFSASKGVVNVSLINIHHRIVLVARLA